ncbi:13707_t:CDS:10 [Cetraspora pellucida]|uniref:13707_t:CDS:1 n=1 Tax=Cetraspora pellucida TaxID=1433469 RepID=A0ACA9K4V1_9GLOM|nr:13707_t:CDS:10 [Cetraspora pellucida]
MDALHFKIDHLKLLWSEYRSANEGVDRDYSDQSEWARGKLQVEIEECCQIFGRRVDTVIPKAAALNVELNDSARDELRCIRDSLREEMALTKTNIKKWLDNLSTFVIELENDYKVPPEEIFENDLGTSVVEPVRCKYNEMARAVTSRREAFEESAIKLHYYWDALHHIPQDEVDEGLFELFSDKQNPKDIYEALQASLENKSINNNNDDDQVQQEIIDVQREYAYYTPKLPTGLKLSPECLATLKEKLVILEKDYVTRKNKLNAMQKDVKSLYKELNVPLEERIELIDSLDEEYIERLSLEHERLKEIMRVIIQKAIEEYTSQLVELWNKCLVPQFERDEFFANVHKLNSAEDVYELLAHEVARLQELYAKCAKIYKLMLERRALIEKMTEFEKKASDPRRLFQSSFRLLEEEKWRKSCWPNLVKIEDQLINACVNYEETERKPFMHESMRYLTTLQTEISERIVNQMFFGFEKDATKGQNTDQNRATIKRKDSQLSLKTSASRPVSPTALNDNYSSRRNSQLMPSRPQSRAVSPVSGNSRRNSQYIPSRPQSRAVSPVSGNSRRNSQYIPSRPQSRAVSPVSGNSRRNSQYIPSRPQSRAVSPVSGDTRRNSRAMSRPVSPSRSRAPSRAVSPVRSNRNSLYSANSSDSTTKRNSLYSAKSNDSIASKRNSLYSTNSNDSVSSKRSSLYLAKNDSVSSLSSNPAQRTLKSSNGLSSSSRRSSLYASNLDSSITQTGINSHKTSKPIDNKRLASHRSSLIVEKGNTTAQRSNSVSSTSSESSSTSSVAAPTTPEPSLTSSYVDSDSSRLKPNKLKPAKPSIISKIKSATNISKS